MLQKRIPTIIGLIILITGSLLGVLIVSRDTGFLPRANPETIPREVKITNLTENSFVVSWLTQNPAIGFIELGTDPDDLDETIADERDELTGETEEYRAHYIPVRGLEPNTTYFFKLNSEGQSYDQNGKAFSITTAPLIGTPPAPDTAYGTVQTPAQTPATDTIVYISLPGATPLSALVKQNGNFAVSLSTARTLDFSQYAQYDLQNSTMDILVQSGRGETSRLSVSTGQDQPIQTIILGQDFAPVDNQVSPSESDTSTNNQNTFPTPTPRPQTSSRFNLEGVSEVVRVHTVPRNGAVIQDTKPTFSGSAPPNTTMTITVNSENTYTGTVQADEMGNWNYELPGNLEPGEHTVTLAYVDDQGQEQTLIRSFIVQAAELDDSGPLYSSTPSATLAPTSIPTVLPTVIPTVQPTIIPVATPTVTTRVSYPATQSGVPVSGSSEITLAFFVFGGLFLILGVLVLQKPSERL